MKELGEREDKKEKKGKKNGEGEGRKRNERLTVTRDPSYPAPKQKGLYLILFLLLTKTRLGAVSQPVCQPARQSDMPLSWRFENEWIPRNFLFAMSQLTTLSSWVN